LPHFLCQHGQLFTPRCLTHDYPANTLGGLPFAPDKSLHSSMLSGQIAPHANVCVRESCIFVDLITDSRIYDGFVMHVLRSGNLKSSKTRSMCPVAPMACLAAVISAALFKKL
jgi:hypothetical protein